MGFTRPLQSTTGSCDFSYFSVSFLIESGRGEVKYTICFVVEKTVRVNSSTKNSKRIHHKYF